ncbi:GntR family transcriptional regulator [Rhodocyclaceae bacterium SMB388]
MPRSARNSVSIPRQALHQEVATRLRQRIIEGELAPGAKLNERELSERLTVSRTPLREAIKMLTSNPYVGERRAGTVGFSLPGVSVRIVDKDRRPLPRGEIGHVQVRGPNVFPGYWRMPEKTREEFTDDGFFRTGDLGMIDARDYVVLVGRSKDLIITGGYNVYPKEIEACIDDIDGVKESAVIGLPHPDFGEAVAAVIVTQPGARLDAARVIGRLKADLANFKVPKQVFFVAELPRNTMGKVQKNLRRDAYANEARNGAKPN